MSTHTFAALTFYEVTCILGFGIGYFGAAIRDGMRRR